MPIRWMLTFDEIYDETLKNLFDLFREDKAYLFWFSIKLYNTLLWRLGNIHI